MIVVLGYLRIPDVNWKNKQAQGGTRYLREEAQMLTIQEASKLQDVIASTCRSRATRGDLREFKLKGAIRVPYSDLEK